ncbi:MAG: GvpL/GvpF family gas vesicle protein [Jatrophihabitantaceae bacterium]
MSDATDGTGYYVYVIGQTRLLASVDGLAGIDDAPVTPVTHGELCALTSAVNLAAFRAAQQAREVSETGWLAQAVRAHERVALRASDRAAVLPMRFGTVYAHVAEVTAVLRRHHHSLLAELRRLTGVAEWSVKVRLAEPAGGAERTASTDAAADTGTSWMLARQAALQARQRRADRLAAGVEQVRAALTAQVRDIAVSRPVSGAADAVRMWLLVDEPDRFAAAFEAVRARQHDVVLELTGPWPPYHFVRADTVHEDTVREDTVREDTVREDTVHENAGLRR